MAGHLSTPQLATFDSLNPLSVSASGSTQAGREAAASKIQNPGSILGQQGGKEKGRKTRKTAKKVGVCSPVPTWELAPSPRLGEQHFNHCLTSLTPGLTTVSLRMCR